MVIDTVGEMGEAVFSAAGAGPDSKILPELAAKIVGKSNDLGWAAQIANNGMVNKGTGLGI